MKNILCFFPFTCLVGCIGKAQILLRKSPMASTAIEIPQCDGIEVVCPVKKKTEAPFEQQAYATRVMKNLALLDKNQAVSK